MFRGLPVSCCLARALLQPVNLTSRGLAERVLVVAPELGSDTSSGFCKGQRLIISSEGHPSFLLLENQSFQMLSAERERPGGSQWEQMLASRSSGSSGVYLELPRSLQAQLPTSCHHHPPGCLLAQPCQRSPSHPPPHTHTHTS